MSVAYAQCSQEYEEATAERKFEKWCRAMPYFFFNEFSPREVLAAFQAGWQSEKALRGGGYRGEAVQ